MNKKVIILFILFIFLMIYFLKDPVLALLFKNDFNLETKICNDEENYQKLKKEYDELLEYKTTVNENIISKVIIHDPLEFFEKITIIKGSEDNINVGDLVINELGLIGIISKVNKHTSIVDLLPNKNTHIAVHIGDVDGLLESDNGKLVIKNITRNDNINIGSDITTSNYSLLQTGLLIGKVKEIHETKENLSYEILVEPSVDYNNLNYVSIRKNDNYE